MTWDKLREQWQRNSAAPMPACDVEGTLHRVKRRRNRILWRDGIETVLAVVLLPFASAWLLAAVRTRAVVPSVSYALVLVWLFYVPWRLWRTRRLLPQRDATVPLRRYLELEREAMLAQARMLKSVAWWYLMPPFVAMIGLLFCAGRPTPDALIRVTWVLLLYVFIDQANRRAARKIVHDLIPDIDARIHELKSLNAASDPTAINDTTQGLPP
jgi:hypothetical protein